MDGVDGGQGEAVRAPQAQATLLEPPVGEDARLLPPPLTLSDVFRTAGPGHDRRARLWRSCAARGRGDRLAAQEL
ncbi:hypothetical protein CA984_13895 [Streptosporangium minutum]|uniref:Uncharacterized protein n=1 Tax=Streptosporangium minutum TaxID=569862 RepID=A0A243RP48_9ACTN|nr:hypothetical protein CA984_13895 [Streptosporangium minutum]